VRKTTRRFVVARLVFAVLALSVACRQTDAVPAVSESSITVPPPTTPYTAVFLTNGQVFFGKLENLGSPYPVLTSVYYVQTQMNQETKEVKNTLLKRGSEWHGPDRMVLNAQHILFMEPVTAKSTVATLIEELGKKSQ
jgi:hypothetical protein